MPSVLDERSAVLAYLHDRAAAHQQTVQNAVEGGDYQCAARYDARRDELLLVIRGLALGNHHDS